MVKEKVRRMQGIAKWRGQCRRQGEKEEEGAGNCDGETDRRKSAIEIARECTRDRESERERVRDSAMERVRENARESKRGEGESEREGKGEGDGER